jgi:hypothetical protein
MPTVNIEDAVKNKLGIKYVAAAKLVADAKGDLGIRHQKVFTTEEDDQIMEVAIDAFHKLPKREQELRMASNQSSSEDPAESNIGDDSAPRSNENLCATTITTTDANGFKRTTTVTTTTSTTIKKVSKSKATANSNTDKEFKCLCVIM